MLSPKAKLQRVSLSIGAAGRARPPHPRPRHLWLYSCRRVRWSGRRRRGEGSAAECCCRPARCRPLWAMTTPQRSWRCCARPRLQGTNGGCQRTNTFTCTHTGGSRASGRHRRGGGHVVGAGRCRSGRRGHANGQVVDDGGVLHAHRLVFLRVQGALSAALIPHNRQTRRQPTSLNDACMRAQTCMVKANTWRKHMHLGTSVVTHVRTCCEMMPSPLASTSCAHTYKKTVWSAECIA